MDSDDWFLFTVLLGLGAVVYGIGLAWTLALCVALGLVFRSLGRAR